MQACAASHSPNLLAWRLCFDVDIGSSGLLPADNQQHCANTVPTAWPGPLAPNKESCPVALMARPQSRRYCSNKCHRVFPRIHECSYRMLVVPTRAKRQHAMKHPVAGIQKHGCQWRKSATSRRAAFAAPTSQDLDLAGLRFGIA